MKSKIRDKIHNCVYWNFREIVPNELQNLIIHNIEYKVKHGARGLNGFGIFVVRGELNKICISNDKDIKNEE